MALPVGIAGTCPECAMSLHPCADPSCGVAPVRTPPQGPGLLRWPHVSAVLVAFCAPLSACSGEADGAQPEMPDPPARAVPCTFANATCAERIGLGDGLFLPAYTTHLLTAGDAEVTRGLIVVHGNNRDATDSETATATPTGSTRTRSGPSWSAGTCAYSWGTRIRSVRRWM